MPRILCYLWNCISRGISAIYNHSEEKPYNVNLKKNGRKNLEYLTWEKFKSLFYINKVLSCERSSRFDLYSSKGGGFKSVLSFGALRF